MDELKGRIKPERMDYIEKGADLGFMKGLKRKALEPLELEEKPPSQMTPKELDKEIGKCVYRIGILSHELKKRVGKE